MNDIDAKNYVLMTLSDYNKLLARTKPVILHELHNDTESLEDALDTMNELYDKFKNSNSNLSVYISPQVLKTVIKALEFFY